MWVSQTDPCLASFLESFLTCVFYYGDTSGSVPIIVQLTSQSEKNKLLFLAGAVLRSERFDAD